jgi:hypothetical protein
MDFSIFQPQTAVPAQPDPELKGQWDSWLQNPANRAGLLSFGLQAMTGGWGNTSQQLAAALGAGVEGYQGAQKFQLDQELQERQRNDKLNEQEADRALRRELAETNNKAAMDRTIYSADRRIGSNPSVKDQAFWDRVYQNERKRLQKQAADNSDPLNRKINESMGIEMGAPMSDEELDAAAAEAADRALAARQKRTGGANAGAKTSEISAGTGGSVGSEGGGETAATGARRGSNNNGPSYKDITPYLTNPEVKALWSTPEGRAQLEAKGYRDSAAVAQEGAKSGGIAGIKTNIESGAGTATNPHKGIFSYVRAKPGEYWLDAYGKMHLKQ